MTLLNAHDLIRPDATIRYWVGTPAAPSGLPTLVLLHGATLDHHAWDPQVDALGERYPVVVPDLRSHGESTGGTFDFAAAVADVEALLDHLGLDDVVLVGLSLGGNIAQDVVRRDPSRVRALVVADATCNTAARHPMAALFGVTALQCQALFAGLGFAGQAALATATDPEAQRYALQANGRRTNAETVAILASLLTGALRPDASYRLPVPTLLLHGQDDGIGDIRSGTRAWAAREPLAEYAVIPDAGHASNLDNPPAFTAALEGFLERVLAGAEVGTAGGALLRDAG